MDELTGLSPVFCDGLVRLLGVPPGSIGLDADLRRDLELDSFAIITVVCLTEDIAGREMPPDLASTVRTVGDLWAFCTTRGAADLSNRIEMITARFTGALRPHGAP